MAGLLYAWIRFQMSLIAIMRQMSGQATGFRRAKEGVY